MCEDKRYMLDLLERMLQPFFEHELDAFDEKFLSVYDEKVIGLECFSRMLLGLGPLIYNTHNIERLNYALETIADGVDPENKNFWGIKENMDQMHVEMFSIAFFLFKNGFLIPTEFWRKNSEHIREWLCSIERVELPKNNWIFFQLLVHVLLYKLDLNPLDWGKIRAWQNQINELYRGDGIYSDGEEWRIDYYNSFAFHFYSLLYCSLMEGEDAEICETFSMRAKQFAEIFMLFFSNHGRMLPYGRSLIYRFGGLAFWSAAVYSQKDIFDRKYIKWLLFTSIEEWMKQDIFDGKGYLNIGYYYRNHLLAEDYNSYGSVYWAFKYFVFLYLDDGDEFWKIKYDDIACYGDDKKYESDCICIGRHGGYTYLYPCALKAEHVEFSHFQDKYSKFCYTNLFGFNVSKGMGGLKEIAIDSSMAVSYDNQFFIGRNHVTLKKVQEGVIQSQWRVNPYLSITSYICMFGKWHTRIHIIDTEKDIFLVEGGFPVEDSLDITLEKSEGQICMSKDGQISFIKTNIGNGLLSQVKLYPNSNVYTRKTSVPVASYYVKKGKKVIISSFLATSKESDIGQCPSIKQSNSIVNISCQGVSYEVLVEGRSVSNCELRGIDALKRMYTFIRRFAR